jgi:hypothetical protein
MTSRVPPVPRWTCRLRLFAVTLPFLIMFAATESLALGGGGGRSGAPGAGNAKGTSPETVAAAQQQGEVTSGVKNDHNPLESFYHSWSPTSLHDFDAWSPTSLHDFDAWSPSSSHDFNGSSTSSFGAASVTTAQVPEPGLLTLAVPGLLLLGAAAWSRRRKPQPPPQR